MRFRALFLSSLVSSALGLAPPLLAQVELVTEGLITPKDATTEAEIVVVQMRTPDEVPGPPTVATLDPPRLVLSSQRGLSGGSKLEPFLQNAGRLAAGTWQAYDYGVEWAGPEDSPGFAGFSGPEQFDITRGEVYPQSHHPQAGKAFFLTVEGPWSDSCGPELERVTVDALNSKLVVHARRPAGPCSGPSSPFKLGVPVAPLAAGRYETLVQVPHRDSGKIEIYATASLRVVPAGEPRLLDVYLEPDAARGTDSLVTLIEIPNVVSGAACRSWDVKANGVWPHGRDLYAQFEVEQVSVACGPATTATYRVPVPDLETGLYRVVVQRQSSQGSPKPGLGGVSEFWTQSKTLVAARQRGQLINGRFRVSVNWRDHAGNTGRGVPIDVPRRVAGLGAEAAASSGSAEPGPKSAIFSFFSEDNWELMVKVLDGCVLNNHYWVFASASTDVEYTLSVVDTVSGAQASYRNELGQASPAITDTSALAVCE